MATPIFGIVRPPRSNSRLHSRRRDPCRREGARAWRNQGYIHADARTPRTPPCDGDSPGGLLVDGGRSSRRAPARHREIARRSRQALHSLRVLRRARRSARRERGSPAEFAGVVAHPRGRRRTTTRPAYERANPTDVHRGDPRRTRKNTMPARRRLTTRPAARSDPDSVLLHFNFAAERSVNAIACLRAATAATIACSCFASASAISASTRESEYRGSQRRNQPSPKCRVSAHEAPSSSARTSRHRPSPSA